MGMSASQARLLSITARMSDNEQTAQALSFAKERLADRSEQITDEYNNALAATKLQIMTGFADGAASFSDVSYSLLSSPQVTTLGKQYIVTNPEGKVLVTKDVADAFINAAGSCNQFLGTLGYSISDVNPDLKATDTDANDAAHQAVVEKIHQAWDRYFVSINETRFDITPQDENNPDYHPWSFSFENRSADIGCGFAMISLDGGSTRHILNYDGTNQAQLDLFNYAMAITESYYSENIAPAGTPPWPAHDFTTIKTNYNPDYTSEITYYKNLFDKMLASGFYTYTNTLADEVSDPDHYIYMAPAAGVGNVDGSPLTDAHTFEQYLKNGKLILNSFSTKKNIFEKISISADTCFQEVQDKTKIAQAEAKYNEDLKQLEKLDSRYDLQLKRLDTEHNTLQTEYDAVKKVISKNVESSFKIFS